MARPLRIQFPGATYHVTSRGNEQRPIFSDDRDRHAFLNFLGLTVERFGWSVSAWVLMTNHYHMVVQTPQPNLSRGMQWFLGSYSGWYNRRHSRSGHLFQGRFDDVLIEKENYFANVLRYVVLNPVRAGMVGHPEDYQWSSYRATANLAQVPEWFDVRSALSGFGAEDEPLSGVAYRQFVLEKLGMEDPLWDDVIHGIFLGSESWAREMRRHVETRPRSTDHPKNQRAIGRPGLHSIVKAVTEAARISTEVLRQRGQRIRALVAWIGWHEGLHTLRSIAATLRLRSEGHISNLVRQCEQWFASDLDLLALLDASMASLRA